MTTRALILGGGGARGAYEAGVLAYLLDELSPQVGGDAVCEIILGTSVGALHACYMGAAAGADGPRGARLREQWLGLSLDDFVTGSGAGVLRRVTRALRRSSAALEPNSGAGWLDTSALRETVERLVGWDDITRNIDSGRIRAVGVATTELATGRAVIFVQGDHIDARLFAHDPTVVARPARLELAHPLASAAIPLLFPAVNIGGGWYVDGGLRMNTPLAPAIHLGADRLLVITPQGDKHFDETAIATAGDLRHSPLSILGRVLSALLLDHLDTDLGRMHFVNAILDRGAAAFGDDFVERLNDSPTDRELRRIDELVIRPSRDPGLIAQEIMASGADKLSRAARLLLDSLGATDPGVEATLLSFLLFHEDYAAALMDLGRSDAARRADDLARFFEDAQSSGGT